MTAAKKRRPISDTSFDYIPWREAAYRESTGWFSSPWQHQIYRSLCIQYCLTGPLRDDTEELRGICIMGADEYTPHWDRFWPKIRERFFTEDDGRLLNKGGEKVRRWQRNNSDQHSKAGKAGADARWGKKPDEDDTEPTDRKSERATINEAVTLYNAVAVQNGWPECAKVSGARVKKLRGRLKDAGGIGGWTAALEKATASDHLMGRSQRDPKFKNWKLDIDFLLQESSFTKLMEGKYDNAKPAGPNAAVGIGKGQSPPSVDDRRAAIARGFAASRMGARGSAPEGVDT